MLTGPLRHAQTAKKTEEEGRQRREREGKIRMQVHVYVRSTRDNVRGAVRGSTTAVKVHESGEKEQEQEQEQEQEEQEG